MPGHTDREYELQLQQLRQHVLLMGQIVEEMIRDGLQALVSRDTELARKTIARDEQVDRLEMDNDDDCLKILARWQPVASDLRFIATALKIVTDIERIGDMAVNIAKRVVELNEEPPLKPYVNLQSMADAAQWMVHEVLDAFVSGDAAAARAVLRKDDYIDASHSQTFRELLTYMMEDPRNISRATRLQSISKYLERIGDHATNVAEMVVFMVQGKDIRHSGRLNDEETQH